MNDTIVDVTEVLDRQKITGFNARLLLLTFLVTTTYGLEISPTILAGSNFRWGWGVSGVEYSVQLTLSLGEGFVVQFILGSSPHRSKHKRYETNNTIFIY